MSHSFWFSCWRRPAARASRRSCRSLGTMRSLPMRPPQGTASRMPSDSGYTTSAFSSLQRSPSGMAVILHALQAVDPTFILAPKMGACVRGRNEVDFVVDIIGAVQGNTPDATLTTTIADDSGAAISYGIAKLLRGGRVSTIILTKSGVIERLTTISSESFCGGLMSSDRSIGG
ncbi:hypothetical protein CBM2634_U280008 [Cupriavidus taiwanensis]|uniref:Uncharacterized protein n=1 Tax=Cupriavidus taiwanensis TaxID=164546 RepID=A0A375JDV9_9BURK|nr:hypothetical protein CBM2634_U280008 [Cupriavidus taiwanensis]